MWWFAWYYTQLAFLSIQSIENNRYLRDKKIMAKRQSQKNNALLKIHSPLSKKLTQYYTFFSFQRKKLYTYVVYFISIFIFLIPRKATEALIYRASNYPNLLPEMPRYCCPLKIFYSIFVFL